VGARENFCPDLVSSDVDFRAHPSVPPNYRCGFGVTSRATSSPPYHQTFNPGYTFTTLPFEWVDSHRTERSVGCNSLLSMLIIVVTRSCGFLGLCPAPAPNPWPGIVWFRFPRSSIHTMCLGIFASWVFGSSLRLAVRWKDGVWGGYKKDSDDSDTFHPSDHHTIQPCDPASFCRCSLSSLLLPVRTFPPHSNFPLI